MQTRGFVTGHDFSRADKANKINRALAPAEAKRANLADKQPISGPERRINLEGLYWMRKNSISRGNSPEIKPFFAAYLGP